MIGKIIKFPFWIVFRILGLIGGGLKLIVVIVGGIIRFVFSHVFGTIFGALVGLLLGRRHVGVRIFTHKKKPAANKK